jgi:hypothetical protein
MRILLLVLGLVVFAIVLYAMGVGEIVGLARRSGWSIAWMILLYGTHVSIRGWVTWRNLPEPRMPFVDAWRIRFAAEAIETLTFTGPFLAEPAKGYMFIRRGVAPARAAGVIAFEYIVYTVVASGLALAGLLVLLSRGAFTGGVRGGVIALVWCLGFFVAGVIWASITGIGLLAPAVRLIRPFAGARRTAVAVEHVESMETHLLDILHRSKERFLEALVAESIGHLLLVLEVLILFGSLGADMRIGDPFVVEGSVKFINTVFIFIPGQFGASEGVSALIVAGLGYPAAFGVTLSLLRRIRTYVVAAIGLLVSPPR